MRNTQRNAVQTAKTIFDQEVMQGSVPDFLLPPMTVVAANLRRHRTKQGISARMLGKVSGITPATIRRIEHGEDHRPRIKTLAKIASALGIGPWLLLRGPKRS